MHLERFEFSRGKGSKKIIHTLCSMEDIIYVKVPLPFTRLLLVNPKQAWDVIFFSIYLDAQEKAINATNEDIIRAAEYALMWAGSGADIPDILRENLSAYNGLLADGADEETEASLLQRARDNPEVLQTLITWQHIADISQRGGIYQYDITIYKEAFERWIKYKSFKPYDPRSNTKDPKPIYAYAGLHVLIRFANLAIKHKIVPEWERVQLACYLAIKSIMGAKAYTSATKEHILARMMGLRNKDEIAHEILMKKERTEANKIYKKYSRRRQFTNLLERMITYNYLACCIGRRKGGYLLSFRLPDSEVIRRESAKAGGQECTRLQASSNKYEDAMNRAKSG